MKSLKGSNDIIKKNFIVFEGVNGVGGEREREKEEDGEIEKSRVKEDAGSDRSYL